MSKPKTHLLKWSIAPNESDPVGEEYVVCGNDSATVGSHHMSRVTCKRCIKRTKTKAPGNV
jgi:hypothetical protein